MVPRPLLVALIMRSVNIVYIFAFLKNVRAFSVLKIDNKKDMIWVVPRPLLVALSMRIVNYVYIFCVF